MSESLLASLQALQSEGADRLDPARFHYMQVLAQRMQAQPEAVRQILAGKLQDALTAYTGRWAQSGGPERVEDAHRVVARLPKAGSTPLADLNRYIHSRTHDSSEGAVGGASVGRPELKSVRGFSEVWSKIAAEQQVDQAIGRGPENAGPLNSHMLMLRSLSLMRGLSPDYLRRFLSQAESLLWLEQLNQQHALSGAKPVRRGRAKK
ncbi:MAG: DUF2894 domain-containing protein [Burkholderiales bacterium]|nr:DUF2894 domain-containing protein [Burkholderiales bacterium]